jgi:hypothetical protein
MRKRVAAIIGAVGSYSLPFFRITNRILTWATAPDDVKNLKGLLQAALGPLSTAEFVLLGLGTICAFVAVGGGSKDAAPSTGPRVMAAPLADLVTLKNGLLYMIFREWDQSTSRMSSLDAFIFMGNAAEELEQVAKVGAITIWGAEDPNYGPVDRIPADAWGEQLIDRTSLHSFDEPKTEYLAAKPSYEYPRFYRLCVGKRELEAVFPRPPFWKKAWVWLKNDLKAALTAS